jgi:endonuclease/exonuclease/phosphatase family metal-dependent hydrolase
MAPEPFRRQAARFAPLLALLLTLLATPAHALRMATWNLTHYEIGNVSARQPLFRTVFQALDPDILIAQELNDAQSKDSLLLNVLNVVEPGQWTGSWMQLGLEGGAIFWKPAKVVVSNITTVATGGPRPVLVGLVKPVGCLTNGGWFRLYSVHFKASTADTAARRAECGSLRTTLNNQVTTVIGPNFLIGGDTNFYGADEGGYQRLTESQLDNDGRAFDPLSMPGHWNSNPAFAPYFTQCPCASGCPAGFSGGGLDDRFDLFVTSQPVQDGGGLDLLPGSYLSFGNDGLHFNSDVNGNGFNNAVGLAVANALHDASDHLPVLLQLQLPAKVSAASQASFGDVLVGASGVTRPLTVSNAAVAPADLLRYSFAAPADFTAPAGPFTLAAGAAPNVHDLGLVTSAVGLKTGTLTVATNDADSTAKPVKLSARVLAHAVASLDSAAVVTDGALDFGSHLAADFADQGLRVHDQGWNALQARLAVTGALVTGGDGHFSLPGFAPATFGSEGRTFAVRFDPAGATLDSTYDGTLTLTTDDEALPGAASGATLTVALHARVLGSVDGVAGGYELRLSPPRPNPMHTGADIEFDLPREAAVELGIFDLGGRRIASLAAGKLGAGHHSLRWNAQDDGGGRVPAGLYFVRFSTPGLTRIHRVALLP